jgi:hypothetical protein
MCHWANKSRLKVRKMFFRHSTASGQLLWSLPAWFNVKFSDSSIIRVLVTESSFAFKTCIYPIPSISAPRHPSQLSNTPFARLQALPGVFSFDISATFCKLALPQLSGSATLPKGRAHCRLWFVLSLILPTTAATGKFHWIHNSDQIPNRK